MYHPKTVANYGSFIPLKYSPTDLITHNLQEKHSLFYDYEVYATHVHDRETQIKKCTLYFLKSVNLLVTTVSQKVI